MSYGLRQGKELYSKVEGGGEVKGSFIYLFIIAEQAALLMCPGKKEFTKIYIY